MRQTIPLALVLSLWVSSPRAAECSDANGYSGCVDANALWQRPGPARFVALPPAQATPSGAMAFGFSVVFFTRPLVLAVPSPDPDGREVPLVRHAVDQNVLLAAGLGHGFELGAVISSVLWQRGAGREGIVSQSAPPIARATERDPRIALRYAAALAPTFFLSPRLEAALPLGDTDAYAGEGSVVLAPSLSGEWSSGRVHLGGVAGARLRRAVSLGLTRWGSQAELGVGLMVDAIGPGRLAFAVEAFALPSLVDAESERARARGVRVTSIPAEWLLSVRAQPDAFAAWFVSAGAGSGIALSAEEREGVSRSLFGATTPELRAVLSIRYSPTSDGPASGWCRRRSE